jgi:hypothetical protein
MSSAKRQTRILKKVCRIFWVSILVRLRTANERASRDTQQHLRRSSRNKHSIRLDSF